LCLQVWYLDSDQDGYGNLNSTPILSCTDPYDGSGVNNNVDYCPSVYSTVNNGCEAGYIYEDMNWISSKTFDITGATIASNKSYFDELGKGIQSQSVDIKTGHTWASQTMYDSQGRPALQSLSAPINSTGEFLYNSDFIKKSDGITTYTSIDFETTIESPESVGDTPNTLGWYYSESNTNEPYQDITAHPFSRTVYSELNPGAARKAIGGNKINGEWKSGYTFSMPASQELSQTVAFNDSKYNTIKTIKTVSRDIHGVEAVMFSDTDGKTLAAARSGGTIQSSLHSINISEQGFIDIHIPVGITGFTMTTPIGIITEVYDLITEQVITTPTANLTNGFYRVAITNLDLYNAVNNPITISYSENYYDYSLNEYNKKGQLIASYQPLNHLETTFDYNVLGQLIYSKSPDEGEAWFKYRKDGQIRFSQNSKQALAGEFSYTNYDNLGRPMESGVVTSTFDTNLDPNGVLPTGVKKEQQHTTYDVLEQTDVTVLSTLDISYHNPTFLAGNVAKTSNDNTTTYYSYDIYGRVKWIVQYINGLGTKTIDYEYDPITSAVISVDFQRYKIDERFIHQYTYNDVNELVKVETSTDNTTFTTHADYEYYENGSLRRVDLAEGLQGIDYVYNLAGQLKSINHPSLEAAKDPGGDVNDLFGMAIDYHKDDYKRSQPNITSTTFGIDQYNGNIKAVRWNNDYNKLTNAQNTYSYQYNNNNWLISANYGEYSSNGFVANSTGDYGVTGISYDANGNIQTLNRTKNTESGSNAMDNFTYHYKNDKPNQLDRVEDTAPVITGADDLKTQTAGNYIYNAIGQLTENTGEAVKYFYNTSGLVTELSKNNVPLVKFFYNDKGQRVRKEAYNEVDGSLIKTEYYVRDAAGSVLAIYNGTTQKELPIYGASRLGIFFKESNNSVYQLTDHLGNVRAVIAKDGQNNAVATTATDYYPFGMPMPNRQMVGGELYRYAFQGQEKDPETGKEAFQLRLWDGRIGRWLTTDPAGQYHSPYMGMGNNPISRVDPDGGFSPPTDFINKQTGEHKYVDDGINQIILVENSDWFNVSLYMGFGSISFGDTPITPNEFGLFQFPESGKGFARYTTPSGTNNGNNENYSTWSDFTTTNNRTTDNWANKDTFINLYKTFASFNDQTSGILVPTPGFTVHYGDISAYDPNVNLGHSTHFTGNSVDIHYFSSTGTELRGNGAYNSADVLKTNLFFTIAQKHGFSNNYSYGSRFTHNGNNNQSLHMNHLHIGR